MIFVYKHPELERLWHVHSDTEENATKRFEDCWALRVHQGLLEDVDGSFFDGDVIEGEEDSEEDSEEDLCPYDLNGHFWQPDNRPSRVQFTSYKGLKPVACIMCQYTGWR